MSKELLKKKCVPCEKGDIDPFLPEEARNYIGDVPGWELASDSKKISKEYKFKDFIGAVNFINIVADVAESEGHHPDIHLVGYNKVTLELSTHSIGGLSENDFILAAKIDVGK